MSKTYDYANEVLKDASAIVNTDRKDDYGDALDSFRSIAGLWNAYLTARDLLRSEILASDVAMLMDLLKTSRFATGGYKADTFVDKAGYSALGGALAKIEAEAATLCPAPPPKPSPIFPDED